MEKIETKEKSERGNFQILDTGARLARWKAGMRILDIGCGDGDGVNHMNEDLGLQAEGIDINVAKIAEAKEKYPGIDVKFADGEFLEDYMSFTFDGIVMGNCLRLINMPDEALHESYCVLKKGGSLVLYDLYDPDPDEKQVQAVKLEADRLSRIPHQEGDCEDLGMKFVDFRWEGAFFKDPLIRQLEETGFRVETFEDVTEMAADHDKNRGSFLLVARKPL